MSSLCKHLSRSTCDFFTYAGLLFVVIIFIRFLKILSKFFIHHVWSYFGPQKNLKTYGKWAVVTGCTDGIGKAYAFQLAKRGMNLVLISRNQKKLETTAREIGEKYNVERIFIQADFGDRTCYANIKNKLLNLDIGILVNNVGMADEKNVYFATMEESYLWKMLDVNCGSVVMLTRLVLPGMMQKKRGLIVNMSSLSAKYPLPYGGIYSPTKAFISNFSTILREETKKDNIKVQCLTPGFVNTNIFAEFKSNFDNVTNKCALLKCLYPNTERFASSAVCIHNINTLFSTGFWSHTWTDMCMGFLPEKLQMLLTIQIINLLFGNSRK